jgi:hypothetical protein
MEIDKIHTEYEVYELPKILFYDIKTGEVLFNYTLDDYLRDNHEKDGVYYEDIDTEAPMRACPYMELLESGVTKERMIPSFHKKNTMDFWRECSYDNSIDLQKAGVKTNECKFSKKSYFVKFNSLFGIINILRRPNKKFDNNFKNKHILNIIPFSDKEINIFTKIFPNKKTFINNPSTVYYANGEIYKGEFNKKLEKSGYGTLYFVNGDKLDIKWKKNSAEGLGKYIYFNDYQFNGYWVNNVYQNNINDGIISTDKPLVSSDSSTEFFSGYILNGKKEGYGVYTWSNGGSYKGMWYNDLYHGYGILDFRDNDGYSFIYEGNWLNGCYILQIAAD